MKGSAQQVVVFVTTSSRKEARSIARTVIKQRLAACATVLGEVESIYRWQGKVQEGREAMMMIKTTIASYPELERKILKLHSYDVPEIIAVSISRGSQAYLSWIKKETSK